MLGALNDSVVCPRTHAELGPDRRDGLVVPVSHDRTRAPQDARDLGSRLEQHLLDRKSVV